MIDGVPFGMHRIETVFKCSMFSGLRAMRLSCGYSIVPSSDGDILVDEDAPHRAPVTGSTLCGEVCHLEEVFIPRRSPQRSTRARSFLRGGNCVMY